MQTIYKYELEPMNTESIVMPVGAKLLHVDNQKGKLCLWALVDTSPTVQHSIRMITVVGTGQKLWEAENGKRNVYIGTAIIGDFVWHVFELL